MRYTATAVAAACLWHWMNLSQLSVFCCFCFRRFFSFHHLAILVVKLECMREYIANVCCHSRRRRHRHRRMCSCDFLWPVLELRDQFICFLHSNTMRVLNERQWREQFMTSSKIKTSKGFEQNRRIRKKINEKK